MQENINKRCEMIRSEQGKMLASLLNKPYNKITLDRVIKKEDQKAELILEPAIVEHEVKQHFKGQFRKRKTKFELMSEDWKKIYEQRSDIRTD